MNRPGYAHRDAEEEEGRGRKGREKMLGREKGESGCWGEERKLTGGVYMAQEIEGEKKRRTERNSRLVG